MHIEPGVVNETKMVLSYATAAGATGLTIKYAVQTLRQSKSAAFILRFMMTTLLTVFFFEVLPKFPVGVSEVHFIFGSTLFLLFGGLFVFSLRAEVRCLRRLARRAKYSSSGFGFSGNLFHHGDGGQGLEELNELIG